MFARINKRMCLINYVVLIQNQLDCKQTSISAILFFTSPTSVILVSVFPVSSFPSRIWCLSLWIKAKSIRKWSAIWVTLGNSETNTNFYLLVPPAFLETIIHWFRGKLSEIYFAKIGDPSRLSQGLLKNPCARDEWSSSVIIWSTPATASMFATTIWLNLKAISTFSSDSSTSLLLFRLLIIGEIRKTKLL